MCRFKLTAYYYSANAIQRDGGYLHTDILYIYIYRPTSFASRGGWIDVTHVHGQVSSFRPDEGLHILKTTSTEHLHKDKETGGDRFLKQLSC